MKEPCMRDDRVVSIRMADLELEIRLPPNPDASMGRGAIQPRPTLLRPDWEYGADAA
jgi:hypothetical protein